MNYELLISNRRSIRKFTDRKVSQEILNDILRETCMAPNSSNGQPWHFIIVNDTATIELLSEESKKIF